MAPAQLLSEVPQSLMHVTGDLSPMPTVCMVAVMRAAHAKPCRERKKCPAGNQLMVRDGVTTSGIDQGKGKQVDLNCLQLKFQFDLKYSWGC